MRRRMLRGFARAILLGALAFGSALGAEEKVLVAGSEGVPVPAKVKHVEPAHPAEALASGLRGIVILDLVIDERGQVVSAQVVRGVPGLDEAAIVAARQWRYEPVKVAGRPVSVSLTVPITFALELPKLERAPGIPELRQGAAPRRPESANGSGSAAAEVTLEADGRVGAVRPVHGSEPWAGALATALKGWRFAETTDDSVVSFLVTARFASGRGNGSVVLVASGLRRTDLLTAAQPVAEPPQSPAPATDRPSRAGDAPTPEASAVPAATPASPAVQVVTAPPPSLPPESGISAVRDVTLEAGVPELARGRRPVVPPLARINGLQGSLDVSFSVGAAGTTLLRATTGPEGLQKAAEGVVTSWVFRRTRADRIYLVASFNYTEDKATAIVRPQPPAPEAGSPGVGEQPAPSTSGDAAGRTEPPPGP